MKKAYITACIAAAMFTLSLSFASAQPILEQPPKEGMIFVRNGLIFIRDARASIGGGGGHNRGNCWKACFNDYNHCVDRLTKSICVPQMKYCLATCDKLSGGS